MVKSRVIVLQFLLSSSLVLLYSRLFKRPHKSDMSFQTSRQVVGGQENEIEQTMKTGFYSDGNDSQREQTTTTLCINLGQEPSPFMTQKHQPTVSIDSKESIPAGSLGKKLLVRRILFVVDCSFDKKTELEVALGVLFEMVNKIASDTMVRLVGVSSEPSRKTSYTEVFPWTKASAIQKSANSMLEMQCNGAYNLCGALTDILAEIHFEKTDSSGSFPSERDAVDTKITTYTDVIILRGSKCSRWSDPINCEHGQVDLEMDSLGASIRSLLPDKHVQLWLFPGKFSDWALCERLRDKCDVCAHLCDTRFLLGEIVYSKAVIREYLAKQDDANLLFDVEILVTKMDNGNIKADGSMAGSLSSVSNTRIQTHHCMTNYIQEHVNILTFRMASCRRNQVLCLPIYICKIKNSSLETTKQRTQIDDELDSVLDQIETEKERGKHLDAQLQEFGISLCETKADPSSSFDFTGKPQQVSLVASVIAYDRSINKYIKWFPSANVKMQVEHLVELSVGHVDTKTFACAQVTVQEWHADLVWCIKECLRVFPIALSENLSWHSLWPFAPLSSSASSAWLTSLQRLVTRGRMMAERALTIAAEYETKETKAIRERLGLQRQTNEKKIHPDVLLTMHVAQLMITDVILLVFYGMDHHTADFAHYMATVLSRPRRLVGLYTKISESGTVPLPTDTASCLRNINPPKTGTVHKWGAWDNNALDCEFGKAGKHRTRGMLSLQSQLREVESFTRDKRAATGPSMPSAASTRRAKTFETVQELDALLMLEQTFIHRTLVRLATMINPASSSSGTLRDELMFDSSRRDAEFLKIFPTVDESVGESKRFLHNTSTLTSASGKSTSTFADGDADMNHTGSSDVKPSRGAVVTTTDAPFVPSFGYNFDKFVSIANHTGDAHSKQWNAFRDEQGDASMDLKEDRKMIKVAKAKLTAEQRLLKEKRLPYVMSQDVLDAALASEQANAPAPMSEIPITDSDSTSDTFDLTAMTKAILNQVTAAPPRQSPEDADIKARAIMAKNVQDKRLDEEKFKREREAEQQRALSTDAKDVPFVFADMPKAAFDASVAQDVNGDLKMAFTQTRETDETKTTKDASNPTVEARRRRRAQMESERKERRRLADEAKGYVGTVPKQLPAPITTQTEARAAATSTVSSIMAGLRAMSVQTLERGIDFPMGRDYEAGPSLLNPTLHPSKSDEKKLDQPSLLDSIVAKAWGLDDQADTTISSSVATMPDASASFNADATTMSIDD